MGLLKKLQWQLVFLFILLFTWPAFANNLTLVTSTGSSGKYIFGDIVVGQGAVPFDDVLFYKTSPTAPLAHFGLGDGITSVIDTSNSGDLLIFTLDFLSGAEGYHAYFTNGAAFSIPAVATLYNLPVLKTLLSISLSAIGNGSFVGGSAHIQDIQSGAIEARAVITFKDAFAFFDVNDLPVVPSNTTLSAILDIGNNGALVGNVADTQNPGQAVSGFYLSSDFSTFHSLLPPNGINFLRVVAVSDTGFVVGEGIDSSNFNKVGIWWQISSATSQSATGTVLGVDSGLQVLQINGMRDNYIYGSVVNQNFTQKAAYWGYHPLASNFLFTTLDNMVSLGQLSSAPSGCSYQSVTDAMLGSMLVETFCQSYEPNQVYELS